MPTRIPLRGCPVRKAAGPAIKICRGNRCESNGVCEVKYDHLQGDRFRHATHFLRWRPDKAPVDCRYDQLETTPPFELRQVFRGGETKRPRRM
jgi:hypothetical protein